MFSLSDIFIILITHWFADFVLQTDKQARGKSSSWACLLAHTINYSIVWMAVLPFYVQCSMLNLLYFILITFGMHTLTDYFTSRLNTKLTPKRDLTYTHVDKQLVYFPEGENYHNFFVSIGFDQILHYVQLFLTFLLFLK